MKTHVKKGFSFLEMLIAITIMAMAAVPMMNIFGTSVKYTLNIQDIQIALRLAQEKLEEFKSSSYPELRSVLGSAQYFSLVPDSRRNEMNPVSTQQNAANSTYLDTFEFKKFKRRVTLSRLGGNDDYLYIESSVWWYDGEYSPNSTDHRYVTLGTVLYKDLVY